MDAPNQQITEEDREILQPEEPIQQETDITEESVRALFEQLITNASANTLKQLNDKLKEVIISTGGRRSAKKRGTQRKQKRRQRRGSRRAY